MYKHISKKAIKNYIKYCEQELKRLEKETEKMYAENEKQNCLVYDLTDQYLTEENYRGQIKCAKFILNNC